MAGSQRLREERSIKSYGVKVLWATDWLSSDEY